MYSEKEKEVLALVVLESCRKDCALLIHRSLRSGHRVEMIGGLVVLSALSKKQHGLRREVGHPSDCLKL